MIQRGIFFLHLCVGQAPIKYMNTRDFLNDSYNLAILEF